MDYPGNFDTPANPAGKTVAISRFMSIGTLAAFFLILCLCGLLVWSSRSDRLVPYMISADNNTGTWKIVGQQGDALVYSPARTMGESVVVRFVIDWFNISDNTDDNERAWQRCERSDCATTDSLSPDTRTCAIYCATGDDMYTGFSYGIVPGYRERETNGETWSVIEDSIILTPSGRISDNGGTWRVNATVDSNIDGEFKIVAYVKVAKNTNYYPLNMGFYIADFNAYRID